MAGVGVRLTVSTAVRGMSSAHGPSQHRRYHLLSELLLSHEGEVLSAARLYAE